MWLRLLFFSFLRFLLAIKIYFKVISFIFVKQIFFLLVYTDYDFSSTYSSPVPSSFTPIQMHPHFCLSLQKKSNRKNSPICLSQKTNIIIFNVITLLLSVIMFHLTSFWGGCVLALILKTLVE